MECVLCSHVIKNEKNIILFPFTKEDTWAHIHCALKLFAYHESFLDFFSLDYEEEPITFEHGSLSCQVTKSEYIAFIFELFTYYLPKGLTKKSTSMINNRFFPLLIKKTGVFNQQELQQIQDGHSLTELTPEIKDQIKNDTLSDLGSNTDDSRLLNNYVQQAPIIKKRTKEHYVKMKPEATVIGQQQAKSLMLRLIHRFDQNKESHMDLIQNALFYGPTGTGKTLLLRTMCQQLGVNFYELDAAQMTQTGYVGMSISEALMSFIESDGLESVENSIIYIDEIDKLAAKSSFSSDVGTLAVQNELLKLLEGGEYQLQQRSKQGSAKNLVLKTNNIMFIASGSFAEIKSIVKRRLTVDHSKRHRHSSSIALDLSVAEIYEQINESDFIRFGLKDEFLGRFQQKVPFYPLTKKEQCQVLKLENSVIQEYKELFKTLGIDLSFRDGAIEMLVDKNKYIETGCRGLQRHIREQLDVPYGLILESNIQATDLIFKSNGKYIFLKNN